MRSLSRLGGAMITAGVAAVLVMTGAGPAAAAPSDGYADWTLQGSGTAYSGTLALPAGFPTTTFTSDSAAAASVPSGASAWLPTTTEFGATYGSSQGKEYIGLRPRLVNSASTSTTVYSFATPTPVGGWGLTFGDIDAESLQISATDAAGLPVAAADLGLSAPFNYCAGSPSPRPTACPSLATPLVSPTMTLAATSATVEDPLCPSVPGNCDTDGAAISMSPLVPLSSLTVTSTWKQGSPTYQTWFATIARTLGGSLAADCGQTGTYPVQLLDGASNVAAATTVEPGGTFAFPIVAALPDFSLRLDPASLAAGQTSAGVAVDASAGDATAMPLELESAFALSGSVTGPDATVSGLTVSVSPTGSTTPIAVATTNASGAWTVPLLPRGSYDVGVAAPAGTTVSPASSTVAIDCSAASVADFTLAAIPGAPGPPAPPLSSTADTLPATGGGLSAVAPAAAFLILGVLLIVRGARHSLRRPALD